MKRTIAAIGLVFGTALLSASAFAQDIKIGVIYDYTGAVRRRRLEGRRASAPRSRST